MSRKSEWTDEMLATLRANAGKISAIEIGRLIGRGETATQHMIRTLGLKAYVQEHPSPWTPEQLEILRTIDPRMGLTKIAEITGYSESSVRKQAKKLGVKFINASHWTPEEIERLKNMPASLTARQAAKELGKTTSAVQHKRHGLGITVQLGGNRRQPSEPKRKVHASPKPKPITVIERKVDICPLHHCPVSNWAEHKERLGCSIIPPYLQGYYRERAA